MLKIDSTNTLPIIAWILHAEDKELAHLKPVTRLDVTDGASNEFHDDGLFSTTIFGRVGSEERDVNYGKINLKVRILHPAFYERVIAVKALYKGILDGTEMVEFDETEKDFVRSKSPNARTGYSFFISRLKDIKFKRNTSKARSERIKFLEERMDRSTMKNLVVIPAGVRDVERDSDERLTKHEINDFYTRVLAMVNSIIVSRDMESSVYDQIRKVLTQAVYDLYKYLEAFIGGNGFIESKFISRRVHDGTRNVITSMDTGGTYLGSPNVPGYDSSVAGIHQIASGLAPLMIGWLRRGYLSKIAEVESGEVSLVDPKTLKRTYVSLDPRLRDKWTTEDGIRSLIHELSHVTKRHAPIVIGKYYLSLVYQSDTTFKVFDSIDELPKGFDPKLVHPISLIELIYLAGYSKIPKRFATITRYPMNSEDSIYPTRLYCKTTSTGLVLRELGDDWKPMEGNDYLAVEFPNRKINIFHDSLSPHGSRLLNLNADHDGDTSNLVCLQSEDSTEEVRRYLKTRNGWINQAGQLRAPMDYDTVDLVIRNLTGRFNHVHNT